MASCREDWPPHSGSGLPVRPAFFLPRRASNQTFAAITSPVSKVFVTVPAASLEKTGPATRARFAYPLVLPAELTRFAAITTFAIAARANAHPEVTTRLVIAHQVIHSA